MASPARGGVGPDSRKAVVHTAAHLRRKISRSPETAVNARQQQPFVAVVVTFNRLALLKRCLAALQAQTVAPHRIIVVDNASTEGTGEWLQTLASGSAVPIDMIRM